MLPRIPGQYRRGGAVAPFHGLQTPGAQPGRMSGSAALLRWLKSLFVLIAGGQTLTGGFKFTAGNLGTVAAGTVTPDAANGNYQYMTNNGAHMIAAPAADCAIDILITNGASAGAITLSGFTVSSSTGDPLTTTNTHKFWLFIRRINGVATYAIKALQ